MEALANVNEFGFCELQDDELMEVDGGVNWLQFAAGTAAILAGAISPEPITTFAGIAGGATTVMDSIEDAPSQN